MPSIINATTSTGLVSTADNSGSLQLATNNGTTAVTIDTSQRVLIGATSASGLDSGADDLVVGAGSGGTGMTIYSGTTSVGGINFADGNTGSAIYAGGLNYNHNINRMSFYTTDGTGRMYIDSSGRVLLGSTDTNPAVNNNPGVAIGANADNNFYAGVIQASATGNAALFLNRGADDGTTASFRRSGTSVGSISVTTSSTAYNTSSDYRLKENIAPMTGALAVVGQLKPCIYTWKADGSSGQGFIAHELQTVVPDAVCGEKDAIDKDGNPEYQGVDTSFLVATLTAAIQELNAKVEAQAVRIAELEGAK